MEYPTIRKYKEAILYAQDSFETLGHLEPVKGNDGQPLMTSGNFAVVFKMRDTQTGQYYAIKCFTQDQPNRAKAYKMIADELRYVDAPYFVGIEYLDKELWVEDFDNPLPVVKMDWVEGESLDKCLVRYQNNPDMLHLLAYKFSMMASWMVNQPFAHGDIKPDNILVREDGLMVLVDYDGLYVPKMKGQKQRECGTPGFRHPKRMEVAFDEQIDDFSLASINLCLYAIALNPTLLQTNVAKDRLLFSEDDYKNLASSRAIAEIGKLCYNPDLQRLYALFLIALSEGSLVRCENRLLLLPPPDVAVRSPKRVHTMGTPIVSAKSEDIFTVNGVTFKMISVQGGTFTMGATSEQGSEDPYDDEKPTHQVTLSDYMIAETEVTQELWQSVMGSNPSCFKGSQNPVERVSWEDCQKFIKRLNQLTGKKFRLPTEAEWEYAARGGQKSKGYKYAGSNNLDDVAWYGENSGSKTHPVKGKLPNELGIYDMIGNVGEWCQDMYGNYSTDAQTNPKGSASGSNRVRRGGSWYDVARVCSVSHRFKCEPTNNFNTFGLRLAL